MFATALFALPGVVAALFLFFVAVPGLGAIAGSFSEFLSSQLAAVVLPFVLGKLANYLVGWLKRSIDWMDHAPDGVKRTMLLAISFALGGLANLGLTAYLPGACTLGDASQCLAALTNSTAITTILTAVIAHVLHKDQKDKATAGALEQVAQAAPSVPRAG
jgi:hypothetical protein